MTRNAAISTKRSNLVPLIAGVAALVVALAVAIIVAKPVSQPGVSTSAAPQAAGAAAAAPRAAEGLRAKEAFYDFGPISMAAGKVSHRFWFRNESQNPVFVRRIYTSCMCTVATLVKGMRVIGSYGMPGHGPLPDVNETLASNEAAYLDVVFDPAAHGPAGLGRTERVVTVEPRAGEPLQIGFVAVVKP